MTHEEKKKQKKEEEGKGKQKERRRGEVANKGEETEYIATPFVFGSPPLTTLVFDHPREAAFFQYKRAPLGDIFLALGGNQGDQRGFLAQNESRGGCRGCNSWRRTGWGEFGAWNLFE